ncbi:DUF1419 domain-containing protein [Mesorhizobium sp. M0213]
MLDGVATREQMFQLFGRHKDAPGIDPLSGTPYSAEWFEINASEYHFMLDLLPPLFMRTGMFGMSEYKAGNVTSVFFAIRIWGRERWFHGFCDLTGSRQTRWRAAIIAHETGASDSMTHAEKLEAIWNMTPVERRGIPRNADPETGWAEHHGKRTILINAGRHDAAFKLLADLSDLEIDEFLSKVRLRRS